MRRWKLLGKLYTYESIAFIKRFLESVKKWGGFWFWLLCLGYRYKPPFLFCNLFNFLSLKIPFLWSYFSPKWTLFGQMKIEMPVSVKKVRKLIFNCLMKHHFVSHRLTICYCYSFNAYLGSDLVKNHMLSKILEPWSVYFWAYIIFYSYLFLFISFIHTSCQACTTLALKGLTAFLWIYISFCKITPLSEKVIKFEFNSFFIFICHWTKLGIPNFIKIIIKLIIFPAYKIHHHFFPFLHRFGNITM